MEDSWSDDISAAVKSQPAPLKAVELAGASAVGQFGPASRALYGESPPKKLSSWDEAKALAPGTKFLDPEGNKRQVPYKVHSWEEIGHVPEGENFIDPQGNKRLKPKYEGVGFTAQTLHDMALTDSGKEQALKVIYGDKVKRDPSGALYVDDNGTYRKADGRGLAGMAGHVASEAGPLGGMVVGGLLGGGVGTVLEPGGGTVAGAAMGGMMLAAAGRQANNVVLALAGVHENVGQQLYSMETEAASVAGGEVVGKVIQKGVQAVRAVPGAVDAAGRKLSGIAGNVPSILEKFGVKPETARNFLGITKNEAAEAADITNRGGKVSPSAAFKEAPALAKAEEFDRAFRAQDVFSQANEAFYNKEVRKLVENPEIGAKVSLTEEEKAAGKSLDSLVTQSEKKVSSEEAGRRLTEAAVRDMAHDDAVLENAAFEAKAALASKAASAPVGINAKGLVDATKRDYDETLAALNQAHAKATADARTIIDGQVNKLKEDTAKILAKITKNGDDPSGAARMIAAQFRLYNAGVRARAGILYNAYHEATNGLGPTLDETVGLGEEAGAFLDSMPQEFRNRYPAEVRDLAKLTGKEATEEAEAVEPETISYAQLHHLRSWFRHGIDYNDLTPDMRAGATKMFEHKLDKIIEDGPSSEILDRADEFYRDKIPFLNDAMVTSVIDSLKSGAGVNPEALAKMLFDPERTAALRKVRSIVGEHSWREVQAAHLQDMLNKSRMLDGRVDAVEFSKQVHQDVKNGLLESAYDSATARRVSEIAESVAKVEGTLPIRADADDTVSTLARRIQSAKQAIDEYAKSDPLKALKEETKKATDALKQEAKNTQDAINQASQARAVERRNDPLGFLSNPRLSHLHIQAADKILASEDLIRLTANRFGANSPEFDSLRQVFVMRFLQRPFGASAVLRGQLAGEHGMTEEIQALMFPGVTRGQMLKLANDMEFLFSGKGSDMGGSLAAAAKVLNPDKHFPIPMPHLGGIGQFLTSTPLVASAMRFTIGKYYAFLVDAASHPNFMNWLAENLKGSDIQRDAVRAVVEQRLALGGWFGAAAAQLAESSARQPIPPRPQRQKQAVGQ